MYLKHVCVAVFSVGWLLSSAHLLLYSHSPLAVPLRHSDEMLLKLNNRFSFSLANPVVHYKPYVEYVDLSSAQNS